MWDSGKRACNKARGLIKQGGLTVVIAVVVTFLASVFGTPLPAYATHLEELNAIEAKWKSLPGIDRAADGQELVKFMGTIPDITAAGMDDGVVWADFANGTQLELIDNRPPPTPSPAARPAAAEGSRARPNSIPHNQARTLPPIVPVSFPLAGQEIPSPPSGGELPGSTQFRVLSTLTWDPSNDAYSNISNWLVAGGYTPAPGADASVAGLRTVQGDGVFYFLTHGGPATAHRPPTLWTSDQVLEQNDDDPQYKLVKTDVEKLHTLIEAVDWLPELGIWNPFPHYAITPGFIGLNWGMFAPNALVYISGCDSDTPAFEAMKQAIMAKGASVYVGWSGEVGTPQAYATDQFVFDRLLGANKDPLAKESDGFGTRPFDYGAVQKDLPLHQLGRDGDAVLTFTPPAPQQGGFGLLAPSIANLDVENNELFILGMFGTDPGASAKDVTVGGQSVISTCEWSPVVISCANFPTGTGTAGDVVVSVRGHKSNPARLTDWRGKFTFAVHGDGSLLQVVTFDVHFRADIRKYRSEIHQPPVEPSGNTGFLVDDSGATQTSSGTATWPDGSITTWTGGGSLPFSRNACRDPNVFSGGINVRSSQQIHLGLCINSLALQVKFVGGSQTTKALSGTSTQPVVAPPTPPAFPDINLALDEGGNIKKDALEANTVGPMEVYMNPTMARMTLEWDAIPATEETAPDPNSPR